jgi:armadillo repeat-containing protein 8
MGTSNAAGEQVDLLNAPETNEPPEDDEVSMVDSIGNLSRLQGPATRESPGRRSALAQDEEADRAARARRDDVLVQEQALDLMRNLMAGTGSADMIDYIFNELGQESLFNIFASLLRSRPTGPRTSSPSNVTPTRPAPPHPEIVLSVVFILVHLATGFPRHRQQLLAQTELMRLFIPLAAHPSASVRMAYAWFVINLTWVEDSNNRPDARARALDLRKLGLEERLEALQRDSDLDVRERAKQAAASLQDLLKVGL